MSFISISDSKVNLKGDIVATVTKIGDLNAGTSRNGDWRKKVITILDASCSESMTAWNEDIDKFQLNHKYEITGIYWKDHNGKLYLNFGKYSKVKDLGISIEPNQPTIDNTPKDDDTKAPSSEQYLKDKQKEIDEKILSVGTLDDEYAKFIDKRTIELYLTNQRIRKILEPFESILNGGMIGQFTQIIKDEYNEEITVIVTQKDPQKKCCNNPISSSINSKICQTCGNLLENQK